jgi:hypothetical protein
MLKKKPTNDRSPQQSDVKVKAFLIKQPSTMESFCQAVVRLYAQFISKRSLRAEGSQFTFVVN